MDLGFSSAAKEIEDSAQEDRSEKSGANVVQNNLLSRAVNKLKLSLGQEGVDSKTSDSGNSESSLMLMSNKYRGKVVNLHERVKESETLPRKVISESRGELLVKASFLGKIAYMRSMLDKGIDVNSKDGDGNTALMWAIDKKHTGIIELLLSYGVDVNAVDVNGNTALVWAVDRGLDGIVQILIDGGADINLKNANGTTALMWAAGKGYLSTVRVLLDNGADVNDKNNDGLTVLDWAKTSSDTGTIAQIESVQGCS